MTGGAPLEGGAATSTDIVAGDQMVEIVWNCTPFRADRFAELWRPWAEVSLEYGAKWYGPGRSLSPLGRARARRATGATGAVNTLLTLRSLP